MPLGERELIERIRRRAGRSHVGAGAALAQGIGDDCAVVRPPRGHELLVTTDFSLEGIHFRREWHTAEAVGHRCLTRGLSDIAAMGGAPLAAFLSLALPADLPPRWVEEFLRGFMRLARRFKTPLAGGDTAQSPGGVLADIVVLGSVPRGKAVLRSGARPGDDIYVTGTLGAGIAGLQQLRREFPVPSFQFPERQATFARNRKPETGSRKLGDENRKLETGNWKLAFRKHFYPTPRLEVGGWLRERGLVSAMIDISDGLSTELSHICEESKTGAWIAEAAVPVAPGATLEDALHGGDEYELLFTAPAAKHDRIPDRICGTPIRWIGAITPKRGAWLVGPGMKSRQPLTPQGWEHFKKSDDRVIG